MKLLVLLCISIIAIAATNVTNKSVSTVETSTLSTQTIELDTPNPKLTNKDSATAPKKTTILFGVASFYSNSFEGKQTANGEIFRQKGMTCASNNVPLGTWLKVTNTRNNKTIIVKVNDRMAPSMARKGRVVDLTYAGAVQLNFVSSGLTQVKVEILGKKKP